MTQTTLKKLAKLVGTSVGVIFSENGWDNKEIAFSGTLKYTPRDNSTSGNYHIGKKVIPMDAIVRVRQRDYDIGLVYVNSRTQELQAA